MTNLNIYSKEQIDAKIPATSSASNGDVLTFNGTSTEWAPASGGGGMSAHTFNDTASLKTALTNNPNALVLVKMPYGLNGYIRFNGRICTTVEMDYEEDALTFISATTSWVITSSGQFPTSGNIMNLIINIADLTETPGTTTVSGYYFAGANGTLVSTSGLTVSNITLYY